MPFQYPATEVFSPAGARRVVWCIEEYTEAIAEGYADVAPIEPAPALIQEPQEEASPARRGPGRPKKEAIPSAHVIDSADDH